MNNPYEVLEVSQNASKKEIIRGKMIAMKKRKFSMQEIQIAEKQLLIPSKRLVVEIDTIHYSWHFPICETNL